MEPPNKEPITTLGKLLDFTSQVLGISERGYVLGRDSMLRIL